MYTVGGLLIYQFLNISHSNLSTGSGVMLPPSGEAAPRKKASSTARGLTVFSNGKMSRSRPNRLCGSFDCVKLSRGGLAAATVSACSRNIA